MDSNACKASIDQIIDNVGKIILGKEKQVRLSLACVLARGHLLIEDIPGVGKTTMAHVLASCLGLDFQRIQFTSDLLPADILGASIYKRETGEFQFMPGPIFSQLILADEVNRTTPKTQSALLEAMEENQVTVEGQTHALPTPFFVIATQNPHYQIGTFPLPESQLDRFLMRIAMGYPDQPAERALLKGENRRELMAHLQPTITAEELHNIQLILPKIHTSDALIDYVQALLAFSREAPFYHFGLSPRAGIALLRGAQAWAMMDGRDHVIPEDIQAILPHVVGHRLQPAADFRDQPADALTDHMRNVAIP